MAPTSIPLGPFDLRRPLGRGGMAEVWEGVHRPSGAAVAIKVLTGKGARTPSFRAAFRNEARAAGGLDHPNILRVYDHGEIPPEVERLSDALLRAGDPYLVMELATGGSLARLCGQVDWATTRRVLLGLLDALAHAHARGVIHRDLKPDNVLLVRATSEAESWLDEDARFDLPRGGEGSGTLEIKLSDFGLAVALDHPDAGGLGESAAGTPAYMAPEQVEGRWRDHGPWTDLYGLGCLAWALVSGAAPFAGLPLMEQVEAHRRRALPELSPAAACAPPRAFEDWVRRLLAKDPADRFRWAADAAWALSNMQCEDEDDAPNSAFPFLIELPTVEPRAGATLQLSEVSLARVTWAELEPVEEDASAELEPSPPRSALWSSQRASAPPLPESWRLTRIAHAAPRLRGAGLGLFRTRAPPLVGREAERDLLWSALSEVHAQGRARVVLLEGAAGIGKSRLARWLCELAHEVGAAQVFSAPLSPDGMSGLEVLLEQRLHLRGLPRPELQQRLDALLRAQGEEAPDEVAALTELVLPAKAADRAAGARLARFQGPTERVALMHRFLARFAAERPVIALLDDAHHSREALLLARHVLEEPGADATPLLVLLTVEPEAAATRAEARALLDALDASPDVLRCRIGPLAPEHHAALVRELLGLESELVASVAERTAGNPLFAVQLLQAWVDRGWLAPGHGGFRLRSGARPDLPDSLYKLGESRLGALLEGRPPADGLALELAAVLGHVVDGAEWAEAAQASGSAVPVDLVDRLARDGLAEPLQADALGGFRFVQAVLRESLLRRAAEAGRLAGHHAICAEVLAARSDPSGAVTERGLHATRLGRHLRAAGRPLEAVEPLLLGVRGRVVSGDHAAARALLREWEEAAAEGPLPAEDARWGEGWALLGDVAMREGRAEEAHGWFSHAIEAARAFDWERILTRALVGVAWANLDLGALDASERELAEAAARAGRLEEPGVLAECLRFQARLHLWRGEHDEATQVGLRALALYEAERDHLGAGQVLAVLTDAAIWGGQLERASDFATRAMAEYERCGYRWGVAFCANSLGEIARSRGLLDEALGQYRRALALYRAIGAGQALVPFVNIGLTLLERGQAARARAILETGLGVAEERGMRLLAAALRLAVLTPLAEQGEWAGWDQQIEAAERVLAETGSVDVDNARTARMAATAAERVGDRARAARAMQISLQQWRALGRVEEAARAEEELARLAVRAT